MAYNFVKASTQYISSTYPLGANMFPCTMAGWINLNGTPDGGPAIIGLSHSTGSGAIAIQYATGFGVRAWHRSNTGAEVGAYYAPTLSTGTWHHIAGVFSSLSSRSIYVNGVLRSTNTQVQTTTTVNTYNIGTIFSASPNYALVNGQLAEVGIWNSDLSSEEILSLSKNFSPALIRPMNLVSYVPLLRNINDLERGSINTAINNPTVATHPRIIMPG